MSAEIVRLETLGRAAVRSDGAVTAEIRARITSGRLPLGARISDKQLSTELGLSRTPVREALVQLQTEGLVVIRPQSGTFVFDLAVEEMHEICETRAILEAGALRLAAERGAADAIARLGLLIGRAAIAVDDDDVAQCDDLDCQFHEGILAASGNGYLMRAYSSISDKLRALRHRMPRERERVARAVSQHRHIIDLWAAGRVEQAAAEIAAHVRNVERLLTAVPASRPAVSKRPS